HAYMTEIQPMQQIGLLFPYADVPDVLNNVFGVPALAPPSIPVAPALSNPYLYYNINGASAQADYVSQWQNYFFAIIDTNVQNNSPICGGPPTLAAALTGLPRTLANVAGIAPGNCAICYAVTPPSAPLAYRTVFQDAYTVTKAPPPSPPANQISNN